MKKIEMIQRAANKMAPGLRDLAYKDRLKWLNLLALAHERRSDYSV